ncbi:MAG: hypothetical protein KIS78_05795 [Labilithrix sp.]|nr:hypothetical protein [Labilithrix sp.]MCW5831949.1 hypothetical protein [Labilithrix sp.]
MLELLVIGATLTAAAWAAGAQAHRRSVASRALDRYAQSRGVVFVPPPSSPRGASPRVVGAKDDVPYVVELLRLGGEVRTRLTATPPRGRAPVLSVLQRGMFATARPPALRIDDEAFDRAYVVTAGAAHDAEGLCLAARALLFLGDRCRGVWLAADGAKIAVSWLGAETDPLVLDAARDAVVALAALHLPAAPYR